MSPRPSVPRFLLIVAAAWMWPVPAATQRDDLSADARVAIARQIDGSIQQHFAHWAGAPRDRVDASLRTYLDQARNPIVQ
jgi:hypothetical protein